MSGLLSSAPLLLAVATGGAFGALARYGVIGLTHAALGPGATPLATLAVNITGCGIMGAVFGLMLAGQITIGESMRGFLFIGFLGAFTTFSAFSFDTFGFAAKDALWQAGLYIAASVLLSLAAFFLAAKIMRVIFAGQ